MSKKLVIFGDSFSAFGVGMSEKDTSGNIWFLELAKKLNLEIKNYSHGGSSLEFSLREYGKYLSSHHYDEQDIIIFVLTSMYRSPILVDDIEPHYASYLTSFIDGSLPKEHPAYAHYEEHKIMYTSIYLNFSLDLAHSLRKTLVLSLKYLPNECIVIPAFESSIHFYNDMNHIFSSTDNCVIIKEDLYTISENEYKNSTYLEYRNFFKGDIRNCHLCNTNNLILADQIHDCIVNKSNKYFDTTKYKKDFIELNYDKVDENEMPYFNRHRYN